MAGRIPLLRVAVFTALACAAVLAIGTAAASASVCVECGASMQVSKSGPAFVAQGEPATYTYSVWNDGGWDLSNVQLSDDLCSPMSAPTKPGGDDNVLSVDDTWTYTCTYVPAGVPGDSVTNTATATASYGEGTPVQAQGQFTTTIVGLDITKTVDKTTADPFDTLNYTITVTNNGPSYIYFSGNVYDEQCDPTSTDPNTDGNYYDDLMPGQSIVFTCSRVYDPEADGSTFTNEACVTGFIHFMQSALARALVVGDYNGVQKCASATTTLATHAVTGVVFEDMNADGLPQAGEPPLPGVGVYADLNNNGARDEGEPSSTSDGQGNYSVSVQLGTTTIREDVPGGFTCSFPSGCSYSVDLPKNSAPVPPVVLSRRVAGRADDPTGKDFGNWRPASVTGTVIGDDNGNGVRDSGEVGLAGIAVFADLDGNGVLGQGEPSTSSAADGTYVLTGLKPGGYVIRHVLAQDGRSCSAPAGCAHNLTLVSGSAEKNKDFLEVKPSAQAVLGARIIPGVARMTGKTGCVTGNGFYARIRGQKMSRVVFVLDGRVVKTVVSPRNNRTYRYRVNAMKLKFGVHTIAARVTFRADSATRSKTIRLTFQRCAKQLRAPTFTG